MAANFQLTMWPDLINALNLALLWLLVLTATFLLLAQTRTTAFLDKIKCPLFFLIFVALIARLVPMLLLPVGAGYDIESFQLVGEAFLNGEEVYTSAARGRHPYLPLQMYLIGLTTYLARITPLPFIIWLKLPSILADVAITGILFQVFRRWGSAQGAAVSWALLYAVNPISVLVSAYHGQFDSMPTLLLLLAWFTWHFGQHVKRSAVFLGFAILNKTWPFIFFPVLFIRLPNNRRRLIYTLISLGIPIIFTLGYVIFYASDPLPMLRRALTHAGVPGFWGFSALLYIPVSLWFDPQPAIQVLLPVQRIVLVLVGLFALWWTRRQRALDALLTIILAIFTVTLGMGIQWLLWPLAFAIAAKENKWLKWYTMAGTLMMVVHLYGLHLYPWAYTIFDPQTAETIIRASSIPVWIIVLLWTIRRLKKAQSPIQQI